MITKLTSYLAIYFKYIIVAVVSFLLGYGCYAIFHTPTTNTESQVTTEANKNARESSKPVEVHEISRVTLKEKQKESDPDLVVDNRYIAEIHGQTFEIPKSPSVPHKDYKGTTTEITSDINMTPVVRKLADLEYKRNWEVSTGLGRSHDGHLYVPIGIQRNYNYDRAIEVSVGISKDHVENFQVVHKWKFQLAAIYLSLCVYIYVSLSGAKRSNEQTLTKIL